MTAPAPRRSRGLLWSALALGLAALIGGGVLAFLGYRETAGPDGAVRGYFTALAHGDAPRALGFGELPPGPHTLLTSQVLREQLRLAPLREVDVIATDRHGSHATVTVQYRLNFPAGPQQAVDTVDVVRRGHSWRLTRTAVPTRLDLATAGHRATVLGAAVPDGPVLLFPGALPIRLDTPYLALDPGTSAVRLSDGSVTTVDVAVSPAGRAAVTAALRSALTSCVSGGPAADPRCPLPSDRYVPGSLRARLDPSALAGVSLSVADDPDGVIAITGQSVPVTGRYEVLDFDNLPVARTGTVQLTLAARAYAVAPIRIGWSEPS